MPKTEAEHTDHPAGERPSKTQLKRDAQELQDLGSDLLRLSGEQLGQLDLTPELLEAVRSGQSLKHDGSLKRQRKYIGKLLRQIDPGPIRSRIEEFSRASASATRALHRVEAWRDRLLLEGDAAIGKLLAEHPEADRPKLRSLIDAAREERSRDISPRAARVLFKYLRELLTAT